MENALWAAGRAMQESDDVMRTAFTNHAMSTVNLAFTLMQLQGGWVDSEGNARAGHAERLQEARNKYLIAVIQGGPGGAAEAKSLQAQYDMLATKSSTQTSDWQGLIRSANEQVIQTSDDRAEIVKLTGSMLSAQKYAENLTKRGMKG